MKKIIAALAWLSLAAVAALAALNWPAMIASTPFKLFVTEVELPLGLVILAMAALPLALFFVSYLQQQISALLETRRLLKEVQRAHELADKAEASRIESLRQLMTSEFRLINERLDGLGAGLPAAASDGPTPLQRILPAPWRSDLKGR
jgi:uncharacterized integral membrane protein